MSIRVALAFGASLCLIACGNSGATVAEAHGTGAAAVAADPATNWSDDTLNATKVDYVFSSFDKMIAYAKAHPGVDMDKMAMDGDETEADYARRINADPQMRQVFAATGIDPARYANANGILMGSMFGVAAAGDHLDKSKLPQAAQYYLAHRAEIDARMKKLTAANGGGE